MYHHWEYTKRNMKPIKIATNNTEISVSYLKYQPYKWYLSHCKQMDKVNFDVDLFITKIDLSRILDLD